MKRKIEAELDDSQSGFRQGKWIIEGLLNLRLICERYLEVHKYVYPVHLFSYTTKMHSIELDMDHCCA